MKRKLTSDVMGYMGTRAGQERSRFIPAGEIVETAHFTELGKVGVLWSNDERFLLVDEIELELNSVPA